jgi:hypothetical protein
MVVINRSEDITVHHSVLLPLILVALAAHCVCLDEGDR